MESIQPTGDIFAEKSLKMDKMKCWEIHEYGGVNALRFNENKDLPIVKSPTEVLVEVYTTSVNPIDQVMTDGYGAKTLNILRWYDGIVEFPMILGCDFCGIVKEKGAKVRDDIQVGDKVWGVVMPHKPGSFAEYIVVDQSTITHKPEGIDDVEAAGVLYAGLTAWSSLYITGGVGGRQGSNTSSGGGSGKRLCILGATGGVGTLAVQMAKAENMEVTATCSTDSIQMIKDLGADHVIDYRKDNLTEKFSNQSYDIILDAAGLGPEYATQLPWKFGQYITLTPPLLRNFDLSGFILGGMRSAFSLVKSNVQTVYHCRGCLKYGIFRPAPQGIEYFKRQIESGKIKPIIDSVFEFNQTKEAFQKVAEGHLRGKVIIKVK